MRKIAVGRVVGLMIAASGVTASVYYACDSYRRNKEFHRWFEDRPIHFTVDLSKPGDVTVPFHQTCGTSHGEALFIKLTPDVESDDEIGELFDGFSATIIISDADGTEIEQATIGKSTIERWNGSEDLLLTDIAPFQKGEYLATLRVEATAPQLANREQVIYAKYQLCGLEQFPAFIVGAFSLGAGIIGVGASICVVPNLRRHGFRRDT